eukprot:Phypoly_transcript_16178.p1 GENE.Phypoly_transcript_16178~~Phypoly_transcript_16178.p1  ORF type:complete len:275 (+),score=37.70 Phypoly_transcript_16178:53-877(+)
MSHNLSNNFLTVNLVRHAESTNNTIASSLRKSSLSLEDYWKQYEGVRLQDPPLSDKGREQANALAEHLGKTKISHPLRLFCSALHRSINTAQCLAGPLGATPELWVDIFEQGGLYLTRDPTVRAGKTLAEIEELGVKTPTDFRNGVIANATDAGWWNHSKETFDECVNRAKAVIQKLTELANFYAGQKMTLWLVSHGDFLSTFLGVLLKIDPTFKHKELYFYHDNCGVTQFSINGEGEVKVAFINRHLAPFEESQTTTDSPAHVSEEDRPKSPL